MQVFRHDQVRAILIAFLFLLVPFSGRAQNITFLSQTNPVIGSISFGDVWGDGNIAYMGVWQNYSTRQYGVGIFDISNPANPQRLTTYFYSLASSHNQFEQGVVTNGLGYFASWSGGGVHIVSLTNPAAPALVNIINSSHNGFDRVHTMFLERDFLYEAAHVDGIESVKVFNVADPLAPVYLWDVVTTNTLKVHQITVAKKGASTILYTSGWGSSSLPGQTDIWDVSNVATESPKWLGRIFSGRSAHSSWPTPDGNALVVCREVAGGEVTIYDVSNPANPVPLSVITTTGMGLESSIPHNPVIVSNLLFLSWYQNGIQVFDISDRTKPVRVGSFDTYGSPGTSGFQGNWGIYPFLGLNRILLSDIQSGLWVLDASAVLTGTNNYPPLMVRSPTNQFAQQGDTVTLQPVATGSALKYQWRFNGTNLNGATASSLSLTNVQGSHSGSYFVLASNAFGSVTSAVATLSVVLTNYPPTITAHPQPFSVYHGEPVTFSVGVIGDAPFSYQWRFNGNNISGATNATFSRPSVEGDHAGSYSVVVSNSAGATNSMNALLTIIDSPYLSGVQNKVGSRSAFITWNTTVPSDSQVQFDPEGAQNQSKLAAASATASFSGSSYLDSNVSTNHTILLTGLQPGTRYNFQVISAAGTNHYISGVYQFTTAGAPIIVDNGFDSIPRVGTWNSSSNVAGYYGTNYHYANVSQSTLRTATFTPNLPATGRYDVYVRYAASSDRATNAPYTIVYDGGSVTVPVNQKLNGGIWNLLASEVPFLDGTSGYVRLANTASGGNVVIADAVQFIYLDAQEFPTDGSIPPFWSEFYFGGPDNPLEDADGDGYTTGEEYVFGTSPIAADGKINFRVLRSGNSVNVIFFPLLGNRAYTLLRRSSLTSGNWESASAGPIYPSANGDGTFSITAGAEADYYKLSVQLTAGGGAFSGALATPADKAFSPFATDPVCGPNRAYVK